MLWLGEGIEKAARLTAFEVSLKGYHKFEKVVYRSIFWKVICILMNAHERPIQVTVFPDTFSFYNETQLKRVCVGGVWGVCV